MRCIRIRVTYSGYDAQFEQQVGWPVGSNCTFYDAGTTLTLTADPGR